MLKGKTALVTGSTGGIGEAFARAFAAHGCNVMMNGLGEPDAIEALRASIAKEHGVEVAFHGADVGVPAEIESMVSEAERRFGHIDILVNNAVVRHYDMIEDFPVEKWDLAIAVDLSAAFHTIRLTMRGMKARRWGRIINMSSIHGRMAVPNRVDYVTGGPSHRGNGCSLCRHHHRLKHENGFTIHGFGPAAFMWEAPDGRLYFVPGDGNVLLVEDDPPPDGWDLDDAPPPRLVRQIIPA